MTERIRLVRHSDRIPISGIKKKNERRRLIYHRYNYFADGEHTTYGYGSKRCAQLDNHSLVRITRYLLLHDILIVA